MNLLVIFDHAINYILTIKENIHGNIKNLSNMIFTQDMNIENAYSQPPHTAVK